MSFAISTASRMTGVRLSSHSCSSTNVPKNCASLAHVRGGSSAKKSAVAVASFI